MRHSSTTCNNIKNSVQYYTILHYSISVNMTQQFIPHPSTNVKIKHKMHVRKPQDGGKTATQKIHITRQNTTKGPPFAPWFHSILRKPMQAMRWAGGGYTATCGTIIKERIFFRVHSFRGVSYWEQRPSFLGYQESRPVEARNKSGATILPLHPPISSPQPSAFLPGGRRLLRWP